MGVSVKKDRATPGHPRIRINSGAPGVRPSYQDRKVLRRVLEDRSFDGAEDGLSLDAAAKNSLRVAPFFRIANWSAMFTGRDDGIRTGGTMLFGTRMSLSGVRTFPFKGS